MLCRWGLNSAAYIKFSGQLVGAGALLPPISHLTNVDFLF